MTFFTKALVPGDGAYVIGGTGDYVLQLSFKVAESSTCTFIGSAKFKGIASQAQTFSAGDGLSLISQNPQSPIEGITITCTSGTVNILIGVT